MVSPEKVEYAAPGPGQCIVHRIGGGLFIERADAVVAIPMILVAQIRAGKAPLGLSLDGEVLLIAASNQVVKYRLERSAQPGYLLGRLA